jgi:predicted DNA-binding ribbon-helix-helix protein
VSTTVIKNVFIGDQRTSVRLEAVEWEALEEIRHEKGCRLRDICLEVASTREQDRTFTSALRVFTLNHFRNKAQQATQTPADQGNRQITSNSSAGNVRNDSVVETTTMPATSPGELP